MQLPGDLVESVKRLGATLGVKAWMENRRKRVDIGANANSRAIAETAAAKSPVKRSDHLADRLTAARTAERLVEWQEGCARCHSHRVRARDFRT
jgi:hypothetical protein